MSGIFGFGQNRDRVTEPHDGKGGQSHGQALAPGTRRLALRFCGEVQGVGFRWTSQIVADRVGCTGWVRNEFDGSVSMELQGTDEQIGSWFRGFANAYARRPLTYRIDEKREVSPVVGERRFEVRF